MSVWGLTAENTFPSYTKQGKKDTFREKNGCQSRLVASEEIKFRL
jgi:hypothetical protein